MRSDLHTARKRFGQHFLHDPQVLDRIVRAINPKSDENLVEIGPGLGALTRPLLERCGVLQAVELDRDVIPRLIENCGEHAGLSVLQADALKVDFSTLAKSGVNPGGKLRLVGNLPYNISTPLLFHLLDFSDVIEDMYFMLQKEVVQRICAAPDTEHYGRLTLSLEARAESALLFTVGPGAFTPPPKVDSAVVRLRPRPPPFPVNDLFVFDRVVRQAFSYRRKTLSNALRGLCGPSDFEAADIDPKRRAETLSAADFARLANRLEGRILPP